MPRQPRPAAPDQTLPCRAVPRQPRRALPGPATPSRAVPSTFMLTALHGSGHAPPSPALPRLAKLATRVHVIDLPVKVRGEQQAPAEVFGSVGFAGAAEFELEE